MKLNEIKKSDGTPFKVFTPFWRTAEKYYIEKIPPKEKTIKKCKKKIIILKTVLNQTKYYLKKIGLKILKKFGFLMNKVLLKNCKILLKRELRIILKDGIFLT